MIALYTLSLSLSSEYVIISSNQPIVTIFSTGLNQSCSTSAAIREMRDGLTQLLLWTWIRGTALFTNLNASSLSIWVSYQKSSHSQLESLADIKYLPSCQVYVCTHDIRLGTTHILHLRFNSIGLDNYLNNLQSV